jgi:DNA repair protein RadC
MENYELNVGKISLVKEPTTMARIKITRSEDVKIFAYPLFEGTIGIFESMFILLLNNSNVINNYAKISQGAINATLADKLIIAKYAIDSLSKNIILVHNHPSGNEKPSKEDLNLTKNVKVILDLLDVKLMDHVIVTPQGDYYSMADNCEI